MILLGKGKHVLRLQAKQVELYEEATGRKIKKSNIMLISEDEWTINEGAMEKEGIRLVFVYRDLLPMQVSSLKKLRNFWFIRMKE
jgi:hypothetical protein